MRRLRGEDRIAAGADQSLIGVITRVTQTDYYVQIQIAAARGKILDQQEAISRAG